MLLLSQYVEERHALALLIDNPAGLGYLLKDRLLDIEDFVSAVRRVARGGSVVDPEIVARLVGAPGRAHPLATLTGREREVLSLMAEGRSNRAIATTLVVTTKTVEGYVSAIFTKLDLAPADDDHRRVLAVLTYLRTAQ